MCFCMADSIGFEPMRPFRNGGLANHCNDLSANYPLYVAIIKRLYCFVNTALYGARRGIEPLTEKVWNLPVKPLPGI